MNSFEWPFNPLRDYVGPPLMCLLLLCGGWFGWRIVDRDHEPIPTTGFYRGSTKAVRVCAASFAAIAVAGLLRLLSEHLESDVLGWASISVIALSMGVFAGAHTRGSRRSAR